MKYNRLWFLWLLWTAALAVGCFPFLADIVCSDYQRYTSPIWLLLVLTVSWKTVMNIFKRKNAPVDADKNTPNTISNNELTLKEYDMSDAVGTMKKIPAVAEREKTAIAVSASIRGDIDTQSDLQIAGRVEGKIISTAEVRILKSGQVDGEIKAPTIIVDGSVIGVCCGEVIEILENGKIEGIVQSNELSISKKGRFIGTSEPYPAVSELPIRHAGKGGKTRVETNQPVPEINAG